MLGDAVAHFPRQVEAAPVVLEQVDDPEALRVVAEAARHQLVDDVLPRMAERRVPEVVPERDRFGQLLVQAQDLGDRPRDLRHLERVRETRAVVIAGGREEDLGLVLQAPKRLAVDDAIAIALKRRPDIVFLLRPETAARAGALGRLGREHVALARFELFADVHVKCPSRRRVTAAIVAGDSPGPSNHRRLGSLRNQINWRRAYGGSPAR